MQFKNCPPVLESYLRYLKVVQDKAPRTVEARYLDIKHFLQYLSVNGDPSLTELQIKALPIQDMKVDTVAAVTEDTVEDYLDYLYGEAHLSEQTVYRRKRSSLRNFFEYLIRHQEDLEIVIGANPVRETRATGSSTEPCRVLKPSEISRVLKAISGEAAVRDVAIVLLICTTGLSLGELVKLKCSDYRENVMLVADRKAYLTENCQKALNIYLRDYRDPASDFIHDNTLFVSLNYRRRLTPRGVQKALQKHFDRAGVQGTARDLRHTAAISLLNAARNACERSFIAGYLGYTNLASINALSLPNPPEDATLAGLVSSTWLEDIGKDPAEE